ncbi:DUF6671 family protein [Flavobacterium sp. GSP14]|uniref:DUF6671 family protein n=1 Tax=Flavobacterium sp. GSP14 TaxID=3401734 RepID=UPI003AAD9D49
MFTGRKLLIATKHQKEIKIAPILEKELAVKCYTSDVFDTDLLGTFSGELQRKDDALTTLRNKCIGASIANNCDLILASEGSFGVHPSIFFANANVELVMLKDFKNDIEIVAREISMEANFNGKTIASEYELLAFAEQIQFPSHGIILRPAEKVYTKIHKGIVTHELLLQHYKELKAEFVSVYAETDMRALYNPTRMKVIEKATQNLIEKIKHLCPNCSTPGFDIVTAQAGLPCENCSLPTRSTLSYLYQCKKCNHTENKLYPRGIQFEDPTYCDNCNP